MCQCLFTTSLVLKGCMLREKSSVDSDCIRGFPKGSSVKTVNSADLVVDVGFFVNFLHKPF